MAIKSSSPSSPVFGFCRTLVARRTDDEENGARGWWNWEGKIENRGLEVFERNVLAVAAAVDRRVTGSPTEDAERRKAGREVEKSRQGC